MSRTDVAVRLLEPDNQKRGDLFGRLMTDLFHSLGYHDFRLNIPKSGREIDLRARHRQESHEALAECKATVDPVGGSAVNKFAGALDVERQASSTFTVEGYFVSLSGFTSAAVAQEAELPKPRMALLAGPDVVDELIAGKIVVRPSSAAAAAAKLLSADEDLDANPELELVAHETGWYWCVRFSAGHAPAAFALIHADGTALSEQAAAPVIAADETVGGSLSTLHLVVPRREEGAGVADALAAYRAYIAREYGNIAVDGLPADEHVGSRRIALADLFVPLHLQKVDGPRPPGLAGALPEGNEDAANGGGEFMFIDEAGTGDAKPPAPEEVGTVLAREERIAILAPPGAGKSTLIKRLAVAYGVPEQRSEIEDELPDLDLMPFVVRCRQLGDLASASFHEVLASIPARAELPEHAAAFRTLTDAALRDGRALILLDGLDEISDPQSRVTFVKQLRTFLGTYPQIRLVLSSREAGFRVVAGALRDLSASYRVADFEDEDIERLTVAWTKLSIGDTPAALAQGREVARGIISTDRVRQLARNPLLLTTLLLVRRWVGNLPRKRTALYAKAIEVLLMTWNVEGHAPIDLDEAIPQLAYLAFTMTRDEKQQLSRPGLVEVLEGARREMPEVLGHAAIAPGQFLERVEERSSLLSLSGHVEVDGIVVPIYEFKHLTFQEYLAAVAISEGFYPEHAPQRSPAALALEHRLEPQWLEVIPMAGVLLGRRASAIVDGLIEEVETLDKANGPPTRPSTSAGLLLACLSDEVHVSQAMVVRAAGALSRQRVEVLPERVVGLAGSRYGVSLRDALAAAFVNGDWRSTAGAGFLSALAIVTRLLDDTRRLRVDWWEQFTTCLDAKASAAHRSEGCLIAMGLAFESSVGPELQLENALDDNALLSVEQLVRPQLSARSPRVRYAAAWAYAWLGSVVPDGRHYVPKVAPVLYRLWKQARVAELRRMTAWAFSMLPVLGGQRRLLGEPSAQDERFIRSELASTATGGYEREDRRPAAMIANYYFRGPLNTDELLSHVQGLDELLPARERLLRRMASKRD